MAKIKIICPACNRSLRGDESHRGKKVKCPHCQNILTVPEVLITRSKFASRRRAKHKVILAAGVLVLVVLTGVGLWIFQPMRLRWPDRRPIGVLFLASNSASSPTNPRGWFNDPNLDFTGTNGPEKFQKALLDYADRSIVILKRTGAQGAIVWDLEGEQYPHKTTFIGDPRLLNRLAPEMASVANEFFGRLRNAGLRIGITIRPQKLVFDDGLKPRQTQVFDTKQVLLDKIEHARTNWGATIFYIDSNGGIRRPDEVWQLRRLAAQQPGILLIPEHHYLPYRAFSAPYVSLHKDGLLMNTKWTQKIFPGSFQAVDVSDASDDSSKITAAWFEGDVLLFRAWFWSPECALLEGFKNARQ